MKRESPYRKLYVDIWIFWPYGAVVLLYEQVHYSNIYAFMCHYTVLNIGERRD